MHIAGMKKPVVAAVDGPVLGGGSDGFGFCSVDVFVVGVGVLAFALAAARALVTWSDLDARRIAEEAMRLAAGICIYTNEQIVVEELG